MIEEPESESLERHLEHDLTVATSRLALVEVARATTVANPAPEVREEAERLLASCMLIDVTDSLLRVAAGLAGAVVRTLDAIHLASALRIEADQLVAYDRRLLAAAAEHNLAVASPGTRP